MYEMQETPKRYGIRAVYNTTGAPHLPEGGDEKHQKVRGKESCVVAVMYVTIRFVLAWDISPTKEKYDAARYSVDFCLCTHPIYLGLGQRPTKNEL